MGLRLPARGYTQPRVAGRAPSVLIADADPVTCEVIGTQFRIEGFRTSIAVGLEGALAMLRREPPDIVVANASVAGADGLNLLREAKLHRVSTIIVVLLDGPDVGAAVRAMRLGAIEVLEKPFDSDRLVAVVRTFFGSHDGGRWRSISLDVGGLPDLTPRERDVLQLITNGHSNKEAGRELGISPRTVEVHRGRVMEKFGARNVADLVRMLLSRGAP